MRRILLVCLLFIGGIPNLMADNRSLLSNDNVVNVYIWATYIPDSVFRQFEKETGIRVNYSTYTSNEALYAKLKANPFSDYDVIMPSTYFLDRLIKQGMLRQIDFSKLSNMKTMDSSFAYQKDDLKSQYSVPYFWIATGIAVNTKYHDPKKLTHWFDLWDPHYQDQLLVLDDAREDFSIGLMTLGYSVNDRDEKHIRAAYERLKSLLKNVKLFNSDTQKAIYLDEDITVGMGWNGDIYLASLENPNLEFIYPEEGFVISIDGFAIPKEAKHVENAHRFIDFLLQLEVSKEVCEEMAFSHVNKNVVRLLPGAMQNNPILYPSFSVMQRSHFQEDVGDVASLYEKYFEKLKLE